jgi:hypothetical protein
LKISLIRLFRRTKHSDIKVKVTTKKGDTNMGLSGPTAIRTPDLTVISRAHHLAMLWALNKIGCCRVLAGYFEMFDFIF